MAKRSTNNRTGKVGVTIADVLKAELQQATEVVDAPVEEVPVIDSESIVVDNVVRRVDLKSSLNARLEYRGQVSGELYIWEKAGDTVSVLEVDVPNLLEKKIGGRMCCGNSKDDNHILRKV